MPGRRVTVLDVDAHHGNGTQQIFYQRGDVQFVSIHMDPDQNYPWFVGRATSEARDRVPEPTSTCRCRSAPPAIATRPTLQSASTLSRRSIPTM